ncbi:hypothetical protein NE237_007431 [Protea cynaroides]|uniref:Uncharacterized protein n=1 Tax=Protea cynaroides TaxID=273540 RepID=A0A9Q0KP73_9MAGN|nr:hypothetical protein NE237_007431 [Protea cynaroides]
MATHFGEEHEIDLENITKRRKRWARRIRILSSQCPITVAVATLNSIGIQHILRKYQGKRHHFFGDYFYRWADMFRPDSRYCLGVLSEVRRPRMEGCQSTEEVSDGEILILQNQKLSMIQIYVLLTPWIFSKEGSPRNVRAEAVAATRK